MALIFCRRYIIHLFIANRQVKSLTQKDFVFFQVYFQFNFVSSIFNKMFGNQNMLLQVFK